MEDSDLEEGTPGRQIHHMGQHGQRHGVRLNDPQIHAMSLSNYEIGYRVSGNRRGSRLRHQRKKSAKTWGIEQPAAALMRSPVCHPQCGYNDWKKSGGG